MGPLSLLGHAPSAILEHTGQGKGVIAMGKGNIQETEKQKKIWYKTKFRPSLLAANMPV